MRLSTAALIGLLPAFAIATVDLHHAEIQARHLSARADANSTTASNTTIASVPAKIILAGTNVTVTGITTEAYNTSKWLGIPFAQAPVGSLRLEPPQAVNMSQYSAGINATVNGPACSQAYRALYGNVSEDCLQLNVFAPSPAALASLNATATALAGNNSSIVSSYSKGLPVLVWIYGGSFVSGSTLPFDATAIIAQSIATYSPVVVVALNYRVGIWGWCPGAECAANNASLLGLQDQLQGLKWVQQYISSFGGDPAKVTVMGESAGAISIGLHLINPEIVAASRPSNSTQASNFTSASNSTTTGNSTYAPVSVEKSLFRGAILQSGSPNSLPLGASDVAKQSTFDGIAALAGCGNSTSKFDCLKQVDQAILLNASITWTAMSPYAIPFGPSIDGHFITGSPAALLASGKYANVSIITGDVLDEGTAFIPAAQINSTQAFAGFIDASFVSAASIALNSSVTEEIVSYYSSTAGSPYEASANQTFGLSPYYRYAASAFGDIAFQAPRRALLTALKGQGVNTTWSYLFTENLNSSSPLGAYHSSDVPFTFGLPGAAYAAYPASAKLLAKQMVAYWVNFATALNPNGNAASPVTAIVGRSLNLSAWPAYTPNTTSGDGANMLQLEGSNLTVVQDNYRREAIGYLNSTCPGLRTVNG